MNRYDIVIIGAGPAGMSAAILAAKHGASVAVLDEQPNLGGQIYRNISGASEQKKSILGWDYNEGMLLVNEFRQHEITYIPSASVWDIDDTNCISFTVSERASRLQAQYLLLATGALERPMPVKGWTLPGVLNAGAAQILIKSAGLVAHNAVLAGSGPLLYLLAAQMCTAGTPPMAIVETQKYRHYINAVRYVLGAFQGRHAVYKGLRLLRQLKKAGVKRYTNIDDIEVLGQDKVEGIKISQSGQKKTLPCHHVFLHQGVVPNTQMSRALRLEHQWNEQQRCFQPVTNDWGQSSQSHIFIAGDGVHINGAKSAQYQGHISAAEMLHQLGKISKKERNSLTTEVTKIMEREQAVRPFLDALYPVPDFIKCPKDEVIICRCEEVSAGDIRRYAKLGCQGPNQTKAFGRSGMGPCQGRYCGLTVTELLAKEHSKCPSEIGAYRIRMPIKPISLKEVSSLMDE